MLIFHPSLTGTHQTDSAQNNLNAAFHRESPTAQTVGHLLIALEKGYCVNRATDETPLLASSCGSSSA